MAKSLPIIMVSAKTLVVETLKSVLLTPAIAECTVCVFSGQSSFSCLDPPCILEEEKKASLVVGTHDSTGSLPLVSYLFQICFSSILMHTTVNDIISKYLTIVSIGIFSSSEYVMIYKLPPSYHLVLDAH